MRSFEPSACEESWKGLPLCRRYLFVHFGLVTAKPLRNESVGDVSVCWGLGTVAEGQHELLGAWRATAPNAPPWRETLEDLADRGVEEIKFVTFCDRDIAEPDLCAAYPGAKVIRSIEQIVREIEARLSRRDREAALPWLKRLDAARNVGQARPALEGLALSPIGSRHCILREGCPVIGAQLVPFYELAPRRRRLLRDAGAIATRIDRRLRKAAQTVGPAEQEAASAWLLSETLLHAGREVDASTAGSRKRVLSSSGWITDRLENRDQL